MLRKQGKLLWLGLGVLLLLGTAIAWRPSESGVRVPEFAHGTPAAREEAIGLLQSAWNARSPALTEENERAERIFLNRLAYFVRSTRGTESALPAMRLWNQCYREHSSRYGDFLDPK